MSAHGDSNCDSASSTPKPFQDSGHFLVGEDDTGHWIVSDEHHLAGGIFANRTTAMHFALAECGYDPERVDAAPKGELSLDTLFDHDLPARQNRKFG